MANPRLKQGNDCLDDSAKTRLRARKDIPSWGEVPLSEHIDFRQALFSLIGEHGP
jgi:hypothetical protein